MTPIAEITHCRMCDEKLEPPRKQPNDPHFQDRYSSRRKISGAVQIHRARISTRYDLLRVEPRERQASIDQHRRAFLAQKEAAERKP